MPGHAVRYLSYMCRRQRERMAKAMKELSLQSVADWDSLEAIENSIPSEFWEVDHGGKIS